MPKYLVTTSKDVIRYIYLILQKLTLKKKLKKIGGKADEWYESSGDTYVKESEEVTD